jgi:hypothetical protein
MAAMIEPVRTKLTARTGTADLIAFGMAFLANQLKDYIFSSDSGRPTWPTCIVLGAPETVCQPEITARDRISRQRCVACNSPRILVLDLVLRQLKN